MTPKTNYKILSQFEKINIKGKLLERQKAKFFTGKHEDFRYIPDELLSSTTQAIWGNKVATFIWTKPYYVTLIENEEVASSNLATFNYLWKIAKKPTKADIKKRIKF